MSKRVWDNKFQTLWIFPTGTVPVYISDDHALPWSDELDWEEFCVIIDDENIGNTYDILKSISDDTYSEMLKKGQELYQDYFSLQGVFENIIKRV